MDFGLTPKQEAQKAEYEEFFRDIMKEAPPEYGMGGLEGIYATPEGFAFHQRVARILGEKGWLSMAWPREYGGQNAPLVDQVVFNDIRDGFHAPGVDPFGCGMFAPTLLIAADDEQKARLLPPIAKGEVAYCQGWSEPDAGSDLASLQTMAIRDGDHYVVNGQKIWTTGAHRASHMFLLARTDPNSQRSKGLSVFHLSMDTPGIEVRPLRYMNGSHLYNEVFFNDVRIPAKDRIGPEGEGWGLTRETMNFERTSVGAFAEGKDLFKKLVEYAKTTKRNGRLLSEDPSVRRRLAQLHMDLETGHAFAYKIAWLQQEGGFFLAASSASMSKLFATELLQRIGNLGTEILGLYGQLEEGSEYAPLNGTITNIYQFCMGLTIAAGSNEIQRNIIAWVGLGLPRYK